jgi:hypothetical protein
MIEQEHIGKDAVPGSENVMKWGVRLVPKFS